jgi:hypothetical protein
MRYALWTVLVSTLALSSCATFGGLSSPSWPWVNNTLCGPCDEKQATEAFEGASRYCAQVQNYYERGGRVADNTKLWVGIGGTLMGALGPAASTNGAKLLSGLSGSANAVQVSMDENLNSAMMVPRRMAVVAAARLGSERVLRSPDGADVRVRLAVNMARECSGAAAEADRQAADAIATLTPKVIAAMQDGVQRAASAASAVAQPASAPTTK